MSALRFKVGEIALLYSTRANEPLCPPQGAEVEVLVVGPFPPMNQHVIEGRLILFRDAGDYIVAGSHVYSLCDDLELRKRRPPIPDDVLETFKTKDRAVPA